MGSGENNNNFNENNSDSNIPQWFLKIDLFKGYDENVEKPSRLLYHKLKHHVYEKLYRDFQRKNLFCNIVAGKPIITSVVAWGITLNPTVFVFFLALASI